MINDTTEFQAVWIEKTDDNCQTGIATRQIADLPEGEVLIRVHYSSLNYKDALSCTGHPGVTRQYPHQPGIDCSGVIEQSSVGSFQPGDKVIVTGYDLGMNTAGGLAEYVRVPANWVVPLPYGLTLESAMQFGTAGLTAELCIQKLLGQNLMPDAGDILVTGATGGVGSMAIALLAKRGFQVTACSTKQDQQDYLLSLGAARIIHPEQLLIDRERPLLTSLYASAIDVVGGDLLANILKQIHPSGSVACCGLVAGSNLNTTVLPFILRGINLLGVDSVEIPLSRKTDTWHALAQYAPSTVMQAINQKVTLAEVPGAIEVLLSGKLTRHIVVDCGA